MGWWSKLASELLGPVPPEPHRQLDQTNLAAMEDAGYEAVFDEYGRFSHYAKRSLFITNVASHKPKRGK